MVKKTEVVETRITTKTTMREDELPVLAAELNVLQSEDPLSRHVVGPTGRRRDLRYYPKGLILTLNHPSDPRAAAKELHDATSMLCRQCPEMPGTSPREMQAQRMRQVVQDQVMVSNMLRPTDPLGPYRPVHDPAEAERQRVEQLMVDSLRRARERRKAEWNRQWSVEGLRNSGKIEPVGQKMQATDWDDGRNDGWQAEAAIAHGNVPESTLEAKGGEAHSQEGHWNAGWAAEAEIAHINADGDGEVIEFLSGIIDSIVEMGQEFITPLVGMKSYAWGVYDLYCGKTDTPEAQLALKVNKAVEEAFEKAKELQLSDLKEEHLISAAGAVGNMFFIEPFTNFFKQLGVFLKSQSARECGRNLIPLLQALSELIPLIKGLSKAKKIVGEIFEEVFDILENGMSGMGGRHAFAVETGRAPNVVHSEGLETAPSQSSGGGSKASDSSNSHGGNQQSSNGSRSNGEGGQQGSNGSHSDGREQGSNEQPVNNPQKLAENKKSKKHKQKILGELREEIRNSKPSINRKIRKKIISDWEKSLDIIIKNGRAMPDSIRFNRDKFENFGNARKDIPMRYEPDTNIIYMNPDFQGWGNISDWIKRNNEIHANQMDNMLSENMKNILGPDYKHRYHISDNEQYIYFHELGHVEHRKRLDTDENFRKSLNINVDYLKKFDDFFDKEGLFNELEFRRFFVDAVSHLDINERNRILKPFHDAFNSNSENKSKKIRDLYEKFVRDEEFNRSTRSHANNMRNFEDFLDNNGKVEIEKIYRHILFDTQYSEKKLSIVNELKNELNSQTYDINRVQKLYNDLVYDQNVHIQLEVSGYAAINRSEKIAEKFALEMIRDMESMIEK